LLRNGHLSQITHDDTYVQSLVDSGRLTAEEASHHPRKSVILRALMGSDVEPDVSIREARARDRYLLCTDGLSDVVTAATIEEALSEGEPQEAADRLVDLALRGGGPDNVTCIVADVVNTEYGDDLPVIGGAFVDPASASDGDGGSPAERAARMTRRATERLRLPIHPRRRRWKPLIVTVVVLALLIGGAAAFYSWTQTQYFVGKDGNEVAVFRGVNAQFGPIKFFEVQENTDLKLADLTAAARSQVISGITASDLAKAQRIRSNLLDQLLPPCRADSPSAPPSTAPTTPSTRRVPAPRPTPPAIPTPGPSVTPVPGVDCRKV
jgi:protein phosphatase